MIPPECDYHRAGSVDEALDLLEAHADRDPVLLAGGHGLVPDMKTGRASPDVLVDIREVSALDAVEQAADDFVIGSLVTHARLASGDALDGGARVLGEAASHVADRQIRNRGTIGGNIAEADPGADLPPAVVAAEGRIEARGPDGTRTVGAEEFFTGAGETVLDPNEVLTKVHLPRARDRGGAYVRKTHPASGYAMVGVAVRMAVDGGTVTDVRVAAGGLTETPTRLRPVEDAIAGESTGGESVEAAADTATDALDSADCRGDSLASATYRRGILPEFVERALRTAIERAGGEDRD